MPIRLTGIDWDALDPARLVHYWSALLGRDSTGTTLREGDSGIQFTFASTTEPKTMQNRIHLDLTSTSPEDQAARVERAIELGGRRVDIGQGPDAAHVVLIDPEGNEFCVIEPGNTFLANTGSIGAVNCDGTRALGLFWHRVLGWPLVWDQDEETAVQSPDGGFKITWSGSPLMPRPARERMRFVVTTEPDDLAREMERLVSLGATFEMVDEHGAQILTDPDGNEFVLVVVGDPHRQA